MNNYHYIIASLPQLSQNKEDYSFDYDRLREEICSQLSPSDLKEVELFESGFENENLNQDFYNKATKSSNKFTRLYYLLDIAVRNKKVESLAATLYGAGAQEKIDKYSMHLQSSPINAYREPKDTEADLTKYDEQTLSQIFENKDILSKEKMLDDFRWEKINGFTSFEFFNLNYILAFLAKAQLIRRWNRLDAARGKELFKRLIDEVRGTFNKDKLINKIDEHNG